MAYLREYDFNENDNVLIEYFYLDASDSIPALVLRFQINTLELHVYKKRYPVSRLLMCQEIERLMMIPETPYWKHYVRSCSPEHRYRNYEMF